MCNLCNCICRHQRELQSSCWNAVKSWILNLVVFCAQSERPKSKDGEPMVYRLKDWPSGEEFMVLMPTRYKHKCTQTHTHAQTHTHTHTNTHTHTHTHTHTQEMQVFGESLVVSCTLFPVLHTGSGWGVIIPPHTHTQCKALWVSWKALYKCNDELLWLCNASVFTHGNTWHT